MGRWTMPDQFLETKFHLPPLRPGSVSRFRLLDVLQTGLADKCKLTLVSAPAGYGKTTLVVEWIQSLMADQAIRTAWLSLGNADNDLVRFLGYWIATFNRANDMVNENASNLLEISQIPQAYTIMDELINALADLEHQIVLVLDDYHVITNPQIHEALEYFIDHQPAHVHLVIITREDPPLPLAQMRARGRMTEIRAYELRFTHQETLQFFTQTMHLDVADGIARSLGARTEGWAVGLQLAALALKNIPDPQKFVDTFRGSHRYVLDYLADQVIRQQGPEIRRFLVQTSILERFCAAACKAITGFSNSQSILDQLEQTNMFIIPLDHERIWYRYHHLFADYLRTELTKAEQSDLDKKAARWHEEHHLVFEAVRYALASGDHEFAADVIERVVQKETTWSAGNVNTLTGWLESIPAAALQARPLLSLHASRILYLTARFEWAEKLLSQAEQSLREQSVSRPETERFLALTALFRGAIAAMYGDVQHAIEQITRAQAHLSKKDPLAYARAAYSLGLAYDLSGETESAVREYLRSSDLAQSIDVLFLAINARCAAAQAQISQGELRLAAQTCHQALQMADEQQIAPLGLPRSILGAIAYEQDDLRAAEKYLLEGIERSQQGGLQDDLISGFVFLARLKYAQGDPSAAFAALEQANAIVQAYHIPRLSTLGAAYLARLQLATGQTGAATQWAKQYQSARQAPVEYLREFEDLTLVRILLAKGEIKAVPPILDTLLEQAQAAGRVRTCIEAMTLQALFHQSSNNVPAAVEGLSQALNLAAAKGFVRVFLESASLFELLPQARPAAPELVDALLSKRGAESESQPLPLAQLPDPLTEQELRVLDLIVAGKSNREIAEELVITVGTAKWHVHNVLQKLGVNNRPKAIARARELGL